MEDPSEKKDDGPPESKLETKSTVIEDKGKDVDEDERVLKNDHLWSGIDWIMKEAEDVRHGQLTKVFKEQFSIADLIDLKGDWATIRDSLGEAYNTASRVVLRVDTELKQARERWDTSGASSSTAGVDDALRASTKRLRCKSEV